ncbi:unnamed protein product [Linum tenue]|uniref:F-box domain-containing protein n=1 Tax=Linum tenue TaxID=586396 RepID=A0AAV0KX44_9ROSI|nr:unnamed protein product [Linum tenue]
MALNFSHRMVFPPRSPEDNFVSPLRVGSSCFADCIAENVDGYYDFGRDSRSESQDVMDEDILDVLPSDPFGMNISTTVTAITGWLEDLEMGYGRDGVMGSSEQYQLFAGLNYFIWNNALRFQAAAFPSGTKFSPNPNADFRFGDGCENNEKMKKEDLEDSLRLGDEMVCDLDVATTVDEMSVGDCCDDVDGASLDGDEIIHHPGFGLVLAHLSLRDLLSVEMVCTSLHSAARAEPFFWSNIYIDQPLSEKITDDILVQITDRAKGTLRTLTLVESSWITDAGLKHVLENNPELTKLSVPGCSRVNVDSIVTILKELKALNKLGLKHLRIGGVYGVTHDHYEVLKSMLDADPNKQQKARGPLYYHRASPYLPCDDDRAIDIEMCLRCHNHRLVYDCPAESCQQGKHSALACRACTLCILRCAQCGRCINDSEYEETFCLELLCAFCGSAS